MSVGDGDWGRREAGEAIMGVDVTSCRRVHEQRRLR